MQINRKHWKKLNGTLVWYVEIPSTWSCHHCWGHSAPFVTFPHASLSTQKCVLKPTARNMALDSLRDPFGDYIMDHTVQDRRVRDCPALSVLLPCFPPQRTQCFCVTRSASTLPQINESLESILQKLFWDSSVSSGMCFLLPIRPS